VWRVITGVEYIDGRREKEWMVVRGMEEEGKRGVGGEKVGFT